MKNILIAMAFVFALSLGASAQILQPVKWSYAAKRLSKDEAMLIIRASIEEGWHIYSQNLPEGGPVKTSFKFVPATSYKLIGKPMEPKPLSVFEKVFGMQVSYFEKQVIFQQKVKLTATGQTIIKGSLEYMTCNNKQCLPPETIEFNIPVK